ncbi:MAG: hypothetical protein ACLTKG_05370 [Collinsella intestinalis]
MGDGAVLLMAEGLEVGGELIELGLDGGEFFSAVARASMVACVARAACARAGSPKSTAELAAASADATSARRESEGET